MAVLAMLVYSYSMNPVLFIFLLFLLFGGGGFYFGGPALGAGLALLLATLLVLYVLGGLRTKIRP